MTIEQEEFDLQQAKEELNNIDYMFPYADSEYKEMARKAAQRRVDVLQLRVNRKKNIALNTAFQNEAMYEEDKARKMEDFANMSPLEKAGRATASTMLKIGGGVAKLPGHALQLGGFLERWRTGDKSGNDIQTAGEDWNQAIDDFIAEGTGFDSRMLGEGKSSLLNPSSWNGQDAIASTIRTVEGLQELKGGLWGLGKLGEAVGAGKYLSQAPQAVKTVGEGLLFGVQNIPEHSRYYEQTRGEFSPVRSITTGLASGQAMAWAFALGRGGLGMTESQAMNFARESVRKGTLDLTKDAFKQAARTALLNGSLNGVGASGLKEILASPENSTWEQKYEAFKRVIESAAHETMMGGIFGLQEGFNKNLSNRQTYRGMMERGKVLLGEKPAEARTFKETLKQVVKGNFKGAKETFSKIWSPEINDKAFDTGVNEYFFGKEGAKLRGNPEEAEKLFAGPKQNIDTFVEKVRENLPQDSVSLKDPGAVESALKAYKASLYIERNNTLLDRLAKDRGIDLNTIKEAYDKGNLNIKENGDVVGYLVDKIEDIKLELKNTNDTINKLDVTIKSKDVDLQAKQEAAQQKEEALLRQEELYRKAEMPYTRAEVIEAVRDMVNRKKVNSPEQLNRVNELLARFLVKDRGNKPISVDDAIALLNEVEAELNNVGYSDYNADIENIVNPKLITNNTIYGRDERETPSLAIDNQYQEPLQIGYDNNVTLDDMRSIPASVMAYNRIGNPLPEDMRSEIANNSNKASRPRMDMPETKEMPYPTKPKEQFPINDNIGDKVNRAERSAFPTSVSSLDIPQAVAKEAPKTEPMAVKKESTPKPNVSEKPTGSKKPATEKSSAVQKTPVESKDIEAKYAKFVDLVNEFKKNKNEKLSKQEVIKLAKEAGLTKAEFIDLVNKSKEIKYNKPYAESMEDWENWKPSEKVRQFILNYGNTKEKPVTKKYSAELKTYNLDDSIDFDGNKTVKELVKDLSDSNSLVISGKSDGDNTTYEISKKKGKRKISVSKDVYDYAKGLEDKKAESTDDGFNGFLKGKQPFEKGAAKKALNKVTKYDGKTVKEVIDQLAEEGTLMTEVDTSKKGVKTFHVGASDPEGRWRFGEYFKGKTVYEYAEYMKSKMGKKQEPTPVDNVQTKQGGKESPKLFNAFGGEKAKGSAEKSDFKLVRPEPIRPLSLEKELEDVLNSVIPRNVKSVKEAEAFISRIDNLRKQLSVAHLDKKTPTEKVLAEVSNGRKIQRLEQLKKGLSAKIIELEKNNVPTEVREDADSSAPSAPRKTLSWEQRQEEAAKEIWGEDEPIGNKTVDDSSVSKTRLGGGRIKNYDVVYDSIPRIGDSYDRESRDIPAPVEAMMNLTRGGEWFADLEHEVLSGIPDNAIALIESLRKRIPLVYEKKFADKVINNLNKLEKMVESGDFKRGKIKPISLEELEAQPIKRMPQEDVESWREGRELYVADKRETEPSKQSKREYADIARNVAELYREGKITKEQRKYFYDNLKPEYDFNLDVNLKRLTDYQKEIVSREREKLRSSEAFLVQSLNKGLISFNDFVERRRKLSIDYHDSLWKSGILTNGIRRQIVDPNRHKPQLSRTKDKATNPVTDKELNNFLRGQAKQISKETGLNFKVVDSVDELRKMFPNNDITDTVEGGIHNDTVYLVRGNIDRDRLPLVIAHEVAGHRGVESLFENKQQMDNFFNSLERAAAKDKFIRDAFAEVDRLGYKENRSREAMAKIVEKVRNESGTLKGTAKTFVNFITSRVRRLLRRMGFKNLQLSEAEVYDIAVQALRRTGLKNSNKFFGLDRFLAKDNSSMFSFKQNVQLRPEDRLSAATIFSGGGLVEAGLDGIVTNKGALENDVNTAKVYTDNHGKHMIVGSVLNDADVERLYKEVGDKVDYFHASPVCHNFSRTKNNRSETKQDIQFANATAKAINRLQPKIFTCENASDYKNSKSFQIITKALEENGYKWDDNVYRHDELGGATKRERVIIRAVKEGELPPVKMQTTPQEKSWYEAVKDLIPDAPVREKPFTARQSGLFDTTKIDGMNIYEYAKKTGKPVWISGNGYGEWRAASAEDSAPTVTANGSGEDWIIMPDGTAKEVTPKMLARLMGLPENYKLPKSKTLAHQILGNGVPTEMTREVIAPLLLDRTKKNSVDRKLDLNGEKYSPESIENFAEGWFHDAFESDIDPDNGSDTPIGFVKAKVVGSRAKGTNKPDSDLDIVLEYSDPTDSWSEDSVFNILNEKSRELNGVKIDINPIKREDSGTLEDWLERNYNYDKNKESPSIKDDFLKSLGMSERNGKASWTDERIDNLIKEYGAKFDNKYSKAYATRIDPVDFLKLTLSDSQYQDLWKKQSDIRDLDVKALKEEGQTPFLIIHSNSENPNQVTGHEGRHRMLALAKAGIKSVPVVIVDTDTKTSKKTLHGINLDSQSNIKDKFTSFIKDELIPIKNSNREAIQKLNGGKSDIQFSIGEPQVKAEPRKAKPSVVEEAVKKIKKAVGDVGNLRAFDKFVKKILTQTFAEYGDTFKTKKNSGYKVSGLKASWLASYDAMTERAEKAFRDVKSFRKLQKVASEYIRMNVMDGEKQASLINDVVKAGSFEKVYDIIYKTNKTREREIRKDLLRDFRTHLSELKEKKVSSETNRIVKDIIGENFTEEELTGLVTSNAFTNEALNKLRNVAEDMRSELSNIRDNTDIEIKQWAINNSAEIAKELREIIEKRKGSPSANISVEKLSRVNHILGLLSDYEKKAKEALDTSIKNAAVASQQKILGEFDKIKPVDPNDPKNNSRDTNSIGVWNEIGKPGEALENLNNDNFTAKLGKEMNKIGYEDMLKGQDIQDHYRALGYETADNVEKVFGKDTKEGRKFLGETAMKVDTDKGFKYDLTNNDMLSIAATYLDKETQNLIKKAGKVQFALGDKRDSDFFSFTTKQLDDIVSKLTPKDREALQIMRGLFTDEFQPKLNEVHERLNGVPLRESTETEYFPRYHIREGDSVSDKGIVTKDKAPYLFEQANAQGQGMLKQRNKFAVPRLRLRGLTDVIRSYTDQAALYIGMAEPLRNFNRVMTDSMKREITRRFGIEYTKRLERMVDLKAGMGGKTESDSNTVAKYLSNLAAAKLTPVSALKQFSSVFLASSHIDYKYLAKAALSGLSSENIKEMMQLDAMKLRYRNDGIAGIVPLNAKNWETERLLEKHGDNWFNNLVDKGLNLSIEADKRALGIIYKATKLMAEDMGKGSDKAWIEKKFMDAVRHTQNTTDLASATGWQERSRGSSVWAFANMYLNQTQKIANEYFRLKREIADVEDRYGKNSSQYKEVKGRMTNYVIGIALMNAMTIGAGSLASSILGNNKDDDKKNLKQKALEFAADSTMNLVGNPVLKTALGGSGYALRKAFPKAFGGESTRPSASRFGDDLTGFIPDAVYTIGQISEDMNSDEPFVKRFKKIATDALSSRAFETSLAMGRIPTWFGRYPAQILRNRLGDSDKGGKKPSSSYAPSFSSGSSRLFSGNRTFGNNRTFGGKRMF